MPPADDPTPSPSSAPTARLASQTELLGLIRVGALVRRSPRVEVYDAEHLVLGRPVRVWLRLDLAGADAVTRESFVRAMNTLARARRGELLDVYQPFEHEGLSGVVTEAFSAPTLASELEDRPQVAWSAAATRAWITPLLRALHVLHELGLVHGRLSPASVARPRSEARLIDLAELRLEPPRLTALGDDPEDLRRLAPEWFAAPEEVGPAADLYAVGCILFRLLTGREPFEGDDPAALALGHLSERTAELDARVEQLEPGMGRIVLRALTRHPKLRFESAAEMADAVEQHLTYLRPVAIAPPSWAERLEVLRETLAPPAAQQPTSAPDDADDTEHWQGPPPEDPLATMPGRFIRLPPELAAASPAAPEPAPEPLASSAPAPAPASLAAAPRPARSVPWSLLGLALATCAALLAWWLLSARDPAVEVRVQARPGHVRELLGGELLASDDMVVVPAGVAIIGGGTASGLPDAETRDPRAVRLSAFAIDRLEVTVAEYEACVARGQCEPRQGRPVPGDDAPRLPVTRVTWNGAEAYCKAQGKRLPTEAEWEKAARGSDGRAWPWGEAFSCARANVAGAPGGLCAATDDGAPLAPGTPEPVGQRAAGASPYGVENLADNVWEWTADAWAGADWHLQQGARVDPSGPVSSVGRVIKGGDFAAAPRPAAARAWNAVEAASPRGGFRCAASLPSAPGSGQDALFGRAPAQHDERFSRYLLAGDQRLLARPRRPVPSSP